jgi:hypothetical protein
MVPHARARAQFAVVRSALDLSTVHMTDHRHRCSARTPLLICRHSSIRTQRFVACRMVQDGVGRLRRKLESIDKELQAADAAARAAGLSASSMVALQVNRVAPLSQHSDTRRASRTMQSSARCSKCLHHVNPQTLAGLQLVTPCEAGTPQCRAWMANQQGKTYPTAVCDGRRRRRG